MYNKPDTLDLINAFDLLIKYRDRLIEIKEAVENEEFETIDSSDPWIALTYYRESMAYQKYEIKDLSEAVYKDVSSLKKYNYSPEDYERIQKSLATEVDDTFSNWTLSDVYLYLQMLFEDLKYNDGGMDDVVIENCIIQGELLSIIDCLLYRI